MMQREKPNPCRAFTSHALFGVRQRFRQRSVAERVAEAVADRVAEQQLQNWSWTGGLRALARTRPGTRADALLKPQKDANGLRALALSTAFSWASIHPCPDTATRSGSRWSPAVLGQRRWQRSGLKTLRALAECRGMPAGAHAPDRRPGPRFARSENRAAVRRAARNQHRLSRAWGRSCDFRSLGLAHAEAVTDSLRAGALSSSFGARAPNPGSSAPWGACAHARLGPGRCLRTAEALRCLRALGNESCRASALGRVPAASARRQNPLLVAINIVPFSQINSEGGR